VLKVVRDHRGNVQDMSYSQVVQDLRVRCMELVPQVQTALQDLARIVLCYKGAGVEARGSEFTKLGISVSEYIESISAEINFSDPLVFKCLNQ